jgi:mevalonate pyrophosphate decarboxylase
MLFCTNQYRAASVVPGRLAAIERAFLDKDFETFGRITMQDSNQFHACCADTYVAVTSAPSPNARVVDIFCAPLVFLQLSSYLLHE